MTRSSYLATLNSLLVSLLLVVPACATPVGDLPVETLPATEPTSTDDRSDADRLIISAIEHTMAGRDREAMCDYQQAFDLLQQIDDKMGCLTLLGQMTTTEAQAGNHPAAQSYAEQALALLDEPDLELSLDTLLVFSEALGVPFRKMIGQDLQQLQPLVSVMQPFLRRITKIGVLHQLGKSLVATGSCESARERLQEALAEVAQIKVSMFGPLAARMAATPVQDALARLDEKCGPVPAPPPPPPPPPDEVAEIEQKIEKARTKGDHEAVADLLFGKVAVLYHRGDFTAAAAALEEQLTTVRKLADRQKLVQVLDNAGAYFVLWSRFQKALQCLDEAVTIHRELGPSRDMAVSLAYLGMMNAKLGFRETAAAQAAEARAIADELKVPLPPFEPWLEAGDSSQETAPDGSADTSLNLFSLPQEAIRLAMVRLEQNELEKAEQLAQKTLKAATAIGQTGTQAIAHVVLAGVEWERRERRTTASALAHLDQARKIAHTNGWQEMESAILALTGAWRYEMGEVTTGVSLYRQAIDLYEDVQGDLQVPELLSRLIDLSGHRIYEGLVAILAAEDMAEEAFDYAERARARAFLNQVGNRRLVGPGRGGNQALTAKAEDLRHQLGVEQHRRPVNQEELEKVRAAYQEAMLRVRVSDPEYADLVEVGTVSLARLQQEVLATDTSLVAYFVTGKQVLAWVVDRRHLHLVALDLPVDKLTDEVAGLTRKLAEFKHGVDLTDCPESTGSEHVDRGARLIACLQDYSLANLYRHLVAPLNKYIPADSRLVVVPHGVLHQVPFAALWNAESKCYLVEEHTLAYAPSASVLPHLQAKQPPDLGRALVLGDPELDEPGQPPLPFARTEAETVADLLGTTALVGAQATESRLRAAAGKIDWLHLATHATYNQASPSYSRVELTADDTNDGHLEVHEVMESLDLGGVNLVVLSACDTARGERTRGDEVVGLSRAFLHAGSPAVVTTLWSVDDKASAALMKAFYLRVSTGTAVAESLREAQLHLLRHEHEQWRSPYYWAAFKLTGDG